MGGLVKGSCCRSRSWLDVGLSGYRLVYFEYREVYIACMSSQSSQSSQQNDRLMMPSRRVAAIELSQALSQLF